MDVNLEGIDAARRRLDGSLVHTPTRHSQTLSELTGTQLFLKFDNLQFTGSFKERGALNKLLSLSPEERARGVVAASAGNHAQAVAHHARRLGIAATIVMPTTAPFVKVSGTEVLGAKVVQVGQTVDAASEHARELAEREGWVPVHPFDDPWVINGQGTLALEVLAAVDALDVILVPVGGGGLISGIATACKALRPEIAVWGVQSAQFARMTALFAARKLVAMGQAAQTEAHEAQARPSQGPHGADTLADGIAVKSPGALTRPIIERLVDGMLVVGEGALERACNELLELEKTVAEGAGAAALAALFEHPGLFAGQRVACVVSGGNMDPRVMTDTILRGLARTGRLSRLRVDVRDLPGSLAEITRIVGDAGANIVDVRHERVFFASPTMRTRLSLEIAARHTAHAEQVADALRRAGHDVQRVVS